MKESFAALPLRRFLQSLEYAGRERAPGIVALVRSMSLCKDAESMTHDRPSPQNAFVGWGDSGVEMGN
jgi:hypothetical protein